MSVHHRFRVSFWKCKNLGPRRVCSVGFASRYGNASFGFHKPTMNVHHMVRISFWTAKLSFRQPRRECVPSGTHLANAEGVCAMRFASRAAKAKPSFRQPGLSAFHRVRISFWECKTWRTAGFASRSGNAKPKFRQPRMCVRHVVRISCRGCKTSVPPSQNQCAKCGRISFWA
jgi:hypothetical protein